jgi:predicted lipid-binding transport protein (Tim44 family)
MGLIKKLFGSIFAFIGGIFGFISKLLGIGGKSEYFLELDSPDQPASSNKQGDKKANANASASQQSAAPAKPESAKATASPAKSEASPSAGNPAKPATTQPKAESKSARPIAPQHAEPVLTTFAPNFMLSVGSQNGRRRPGPNMNMYLDMAKQMNSSGRA